MESATLEQSCGLLNTMSCEYGECYTWTMLSFAKYYVLWIWRVLHLNNPVVCQILCLVNMESVTLEQSCGLPNTMSCENGECYTWTILWFAKYYVLWIWRVLHLNNPVVCQILCLVNMESVTLEQSCGLPNTMSCEYGECYTWTILWFAKYYILWIWRVLHLNNPVVCQILGLIRMKGVSLAEPRVSKKSQINKQGTALAQFCVSSKTFWCEYIETGLYNFFFQINTDSKHQDRRVYHIALRLNLLVQITYQKQMY